MEPLDKLTSFLKSIFPPSEYQGRYYLIQLFSEIGDDERWLSKGPIMRVWYSIN